MLAAIAQLEAQYPRVVPQVLRTACAAIKPIETTAGCVDVAQALTQLRQTRALSQALEQLEQHYPGVTPDAVLRAYQPLRAFYQKDIEAGAVS